MDDFERRMARVAGTQRSEADEIARRARLTNEARTVSAERAAKFIKRMTAKNVPAIPLYIREVAPQGWHSPTDTNRLPRTTGYIMLGEGWIVRERIPSGDEMVSGLFLSTLNIVRDCMDIEHEPPRDADPQNFIKGPYVNAGGHQVQGQPVEIPPHSVFATESGYNLLAAAALRYGAIG